MAAYLTSFDFPFTGTLIVSLVVFYVAYNIARHFNSRMPPGPLGLPLIGNFFTIASSYFRNEHPHDLMTRLARTYGKVFSLGFGSKDLLVVLNDFESVSEAFKNPDLTGRLPNETIQNGIGAKGILSSSGDVWKQQRRFSLSVFRSFGVGKRSFEDRIATEAKCLSEELSALNEDEFDSKYYLMSATSNIICSVIFGDRFDYNDEDFKRLLIIPDNRVQVVGARGLNIFIPLLGLLSRSVPKTTKIVKESVEYFKTIVEKHKIRLKETNECNDYIDLYLREIEKTSAQSNVESCDFIDEKHLLAIIDSLFLAGTETSSNTLAWCLLYVANYSDVERKIQDEIGTTCGERLPSFDDQDRMPFTEAFIMEVQRLHTIVPLGVPHRANRDTTIQGYEIPEGTFVISNLWGALHDPEVWSDPDVFKPERFLDEDGHVNLPKQWITFSTGRRICLGERLAKMEIFLFLTHLLRGFSFKKVKGHRYCFKGRSGATFSPLPYKISVVPRNN